jgi:predicted Zn-dependent protease with MMP-like domain
MPNTPMMKTALKSGIRIMLSDKSDIKERFQINNGVVEIDPDTYPQYSHPAFIPKSVWRNLTESEEEVLITNNDNLVKTSETIAIVKFPESEISQIKKIIAWGETKYGVAVSATQIREHQDYYRATDKMIEYVRQTYAIDVDDEIDCRQINNHESNLSTSTINEIEFFPAKLFAGLHLDSWDYKPFRLRHLARNRVCINLGQETRYFLLVNRTLQQIFDDLCLIDPDDIYKDYRGVRLSNQFLRNLSDYPVIKLSIHPGEAYIAPTENFIHDATSIGKTVPDWCITFLGDFALKEKQSICDSK